MKFATNGMYAYCITETEDGCFINNGHGYVMESEQMIDIANKMIKYAKKHKIELEQHNIQRRAELEAGMRGWSTDQPAKKPKAKAYVYLFECGGHYKVGYSKDVERRAKELNNRPFTLNIVCVSRLIEDAYTVEQELHDFLHKYKIAGEWYDLPEYMVGCVCNIIRAQ